MANKKIKGKKKNNNNNNRNKNNSNNNRKQSQNNRRKSNESSVSSTDFKLKDKSINNNRNKAVIDVFGDCDQRINVKLNENEDKSDQNAKVCLKTRVKVEMNSMQETYDNDKQLIDCPPNCSLISPKGLTNLGNTCYLNSVLQVVSQTNILYELLNERSNCGFIWSAKSLTNINEWTFEKQFDEQIDVILPNCLSLTNSLIGFMREMRSNNSKTITPSTLLKDIRKEWSQFSGWSQQDSHELLRCLLDSLKCKEIIRQRKAIMSQFKNGLDDCNIDDDTKARIKSFATYSCSTIIDSIFGGQLLSSVSCNECHYTNQNFEPFFDLSLPINQSRNDSHDIESEPQVKERKPKQIEEKCLLDEDPKNLTPKERRIKRQQKKAAKRVERQQRKCSESKPDPTEIKEEISGAKSSADENHSRCQNDVELTSAQSHGKEEENEDVFSNVEDWAIEPLLGDLNDSEVINPNSFNNSSNNEEHNNDNNEDDDVFAFNLLYESSDNNDMNYCQNTDEISLDYNLVKPDFVEEEENECCSDETKAQMDLDFSLTDLENELLKLSISDKEKLSLIQTDSNSPQIKTIIDLTLEPIANNANELPNFALMSLLSNFTAIETLSGNNKYLCELCTKNNGGNKTYRNASKRSLIAIPPPILTLHLKRFEAEGYRRVSLKKINSFVSFPARFDLSPFTSKIYNLITPLTGLKKTNAIIYSLYGVVEHSGTLRSGHYTAYVRCRPFNTNIKKFVLLEPFLPKVESILKMIENNFYNDSAVNEVRDCYNGMNGQLSNGCSNHSNNDSIDDQLDSDSGKWYHISDSSVSSSSLSAVLRSQAYILFYERIV